MREPGRTAPLAFLRRHLLLALGVAWVVATASGASVLSQRFDAKIAEQSASLARRRDAGISGHIPRSARSQGRRGPASLVANL